MEFKLRPWHMNDLDSLIKYANNAAIAKNMTDLFANPYTHENGKKFLDMATNDNPLKRMAIDVNGEAIGGIGIHPQTDIRCKNAELGYWLAEPFWGKGIISKAIPQMTDHGFKTFNITRIFAVPFGTNIASQKALEKAGFTLEARLKNTLFKNNQYVDELIYAIYKK